MGLCITRQKGEGFRIGSDIQVTILKVREGRVTLNIQAPQHVPIIRDDAIETKPKEPKP